MAASCIPVGQFGFLINKPCTFLEFASNLSPRDEGGEVESAIGVEDLYASEGFTPRPNDRLGPGMTKVVD